MSDDEERGDSQEPGADDDERDSQQGRDEPARDNGVSVFEWATMAAGVVVILAIAGYVAYLWLVVQRQPPVINVSPLIEAVREESGRYYLPVEIRNDGGQSAQEVTVEVRLVPPAGEEEMSELTIAILAGGDAASATVVFQNNPADGELSIDIISYLHPS